MGWSEDGMELLAWYRGVESVDMKSRNDASSGASGALVLACKCNSRLPRSRGWCCQRTPAGFGVLEQPSASLDRQCVWRPLYWGGLAGQTTEGAAKLAPL